jgi:signal transduction histidine kinase
LQAGHEARDVQPFDAVALVRETCHALEFLASERSLYLDVRAPSRLMVEGDATKTRRIIQNLLQNALRYTAKGGVTVECEEDGAKRWSVCVRDTGPGLVLAGGTTSPPERREAAAASRNGHRQAAGVQESGEPLAREPGEGVGLSIVKRLCELLDASISIHAQPGAGTSFRVSFPTRYVR